MNVTRKIKKLAKSAHSPEEGTSKGLGAKHWCTNVR